MTLGTTSKVRPGGPRIKDGNLAGTDYATASLDKHMDAPLGPCLSSHGLTSRPLTQQAMAAAHQEHAYPISYVRGAIAGRVAECTYW